MNLYFDPFVLPFSLGVLFLFGVLISKYITWFFGLSVTDRQCFRKSLFTQKSFQAVGDVFSESLLHRSIFKVNGLLGYMHLSLALGWFLLIVVGKFETSAYLKDGFNLPYVHVFFRYFFHEETARFAHRFNYAFIMDALLLFVLTGVLLAYTKRVYSRMMGMRRTTKHTTGDRVALAALWLIFPARYFAESTSCGIYDTGSFLTHSTGQFLGGFLPLDLLEQPAWWFYSLVLGVFLVALPFSRYMHIFAEIPHIFLKRYRITPKETPGSVDQFQIQACSRCGVCLDPCQMQRAAGVNTMQAVYYLRDRRYGLLRQETVDNCLMCGRCEQVCPVGIDLNQLRLNKRTATFGPCAPDRYNYLNGISALGTGTGRVGYFAGCMTLLSPGILAAMESIFAASGTDLWYADRDGGVCCGRPLKLAGDLDAAHKIMDFNVQLFQKQGITTLVTSCPICYKVFREDYQLDGIRVLHHTEFIAELLAAGRLTLTRNPEVLTYHDPCELGRGSGIYAAPRMVLKRIGELREATEHGEHGLCCGGSLANTVLPRTDAEKISVDAMAQFVATGAQVLVTSCPLCKKSFAHTGQLPVKDIAEIVAARLKA